MIRISYKTTIWQDMYFETDDAEKVIKELKENGICQLPIDDEDFIENQIDFETEERLDPEDNYNQSTVEVYNTDDKLVYENGKY